jgi:two-component system, cell cycle sensor histidine kinase and response regulator CckA
LISGPEPLGVLTIYAAEVDAFGDEEIELLTELAEDLAFGIRALRTREAHRRAEASLETAQAIAHMGNWELDPQMAMGTWSREMFRLFERDPALGPPTLDEFQAGVHPEDRQPLLDVQRRVIDEGVPLSHTFRSNPAQGPVRWFNATIDAIRDEQGNFLRLVGTILEVTERMRAEQELRDSEERFRGLVEQSLAGFYLIDQGRFRYVSPAFVRSFGYGAPEEIVDHLSVGDLVAPEDRAKVIDNIRRRVAGEIEEVRYEFRGLRRDGSTFDVEVQGRAAEYQGRRVVIGVLLDVSERKRLEEQYRQAQKMEAIGQLAGGVAHDFNNLLTVVQGNLSLLELDGLLPEPAREPVAEIRGASARAAALTRQLLAFSRRQTMQLVRLDLNEVVTGTTRMVQRIVGEDIRMVLQPASSEIPVLADRSMLEQVLLNLCINSRDAMPEGGSLTIATNLVRIGAVAVKKQPHARPGDFGVIKVSDSGHGIPPDVLPHIFEPFYTTKEVGRGTGLGLATVHGIVQQHGGWIEVQSASGAGATFGVFLPVAPETVASESKPESEASECTGNETILFVEDEPALRNMTRALLQRLGYRVLEAATGPAALALWVEHREAIQLVITDMVMPDGMSGFELGQRLQQERTDLPVIYTSGYSPEIVAGHQELVEGSNFLSKPFDLDRLARTVRTALDRAAS